MTEALNMLCILYSIQVLVLSHRNGTQETMDMIPQFCNTLQTPDPMYYKAKNAKITNIIDFQPFF